MANFSLLSVSQCFQTVSEVALCHQETFEIKLRLFTYAINAVNFTFCIIVIFSI